MRRAESRYLHPASYSLRCIWIRSPRRSEEQSSKSVVGKTVRSRLTAIKRERVVSHLFRRGIYPDGGGLIVSPKSIEIYTYFSILGHHQLRPLPTPTVSSPPSYGIARNMGRFGLVHSPTSRNLRERSAHQCQQSQYERRDSTGQDDGSGRGSLAPPCFP